MKTVKSKLITLLLCCVAYCSNVVASESIKFTWRGSTSSTSVTSNKSFDIAATDGMQFTVDWGDGSDIETITGIGNEQNLNHTYVNTNNSTTYTVKITGVTADCLFTYLNLNNILLTTLDLSANTALQSLYCYYNQLSTLDLNANKLLQTLNCYNNSLTTLDLSANTQLQSLSCFLNQLTALDLKANTALETLICSSNLLTTLDLSANTLLQEIVCSNNSLTVLDLNTNTVLHTLYCNNNQFTALDLKTNTALETLDCRDNQLTTLELNANTKLETLDCSNNQLTDLDLSTNTLLQNLTCYNNALNALDLKANTLLQTLICSNNHLAFLDTKSQLNSLDVTNNRLLLSDLYNTTKMMSGTALIRLGIQILVPQEAIVGSSVDYSAQKEFGGKTTVFTVKKNGLPALLSSDYTIDDGIITFNNTGNYTVIMTNSATLPLKSSSFAVETTRKFTTPQPSSVPAEVIAEINVTDGMGVTNTQAAGITIYPNPTSGQLTIDNGQLKIDNVEIFDVFGRNLTPFPSPIWRGVSEGRGEVDISHLPAGIYYLKVDGKTTKIIKQ